MTNFDESTVVSKLKNKNIPLEFFEESETEACCCLDYPSNFDGKEKHSGLDFDHGSEEYFSFDPRLSNEEIAASIDEWIDGYAREVFEDLESHMEEHEETEEQRMAFYSLCEYLGAPHSERGEYSGRWYFSKPYVVTDGRIEISLDDDGEISFSGHCSAFDAYELCKVFGA